jgi:hypothetical protein
MRRLISWSCVAVCLLSTLAGCGRGGGQSAIGIDTNIPNVAATTTPTIDAGQSLPILVAVVNDSSHAGATYAVSGPGSIQVVGVTGSGGASDQIAITYIAPATVTGPTTATVTATSIHTPSQSASMVISIDAALAITTTALANGTVGSAYSAALAGIGGTGTLKWSIASGTLPTGLTLNPATGALTGTPTAAGAYSFSIGITDASILPNTITQSYTVTIVPTPPVITTVSLPNAIAGTAYSQQLATSGGGGGGPGRLAPRRPFPQCHRSDRRHANQRERGKHLQLHRSGDHRRPDIVCGHALHRGARVACGDQHEPAQRQ